MLGGECGVLMLPLGGEVSERCSACPNVVQPADSRTRSPTVLTREPSVIRGPSSAGVAFGPCAERRPQLHTRLLFPVFAQIEELNSEIEVLSAAFAKAREAPQEAQTQKFQVSVGFV